MFTRQTQMQLKLQVVQTKMYYLSSMGASIFTNKVTSTSKDGIEGVSLQLQGDGKVARKITVGIATPSVGGAGRRCGSHYQTIRVWLCWLGLHHTEYLEKIRSCIERGFSCCKC